MNATAYISSGILERHLVGLSSPEEVKELEEMFSQHPEIGKEIQSIQQALQGYVLTHQVAPPEGLRQNILSAAKAAPPPAEKKTDDPAPVQTTTTSTSAKTKIETPPINWWIVAAVAFALGLIAAGIMASKFSGERDEARSALAESEATIEQLKKEKTAQVSQYEKAKAELDLRSDHNLRPIPLPGNFRAKEAYAVVFWNGTTKKSYLDMRRPPEVPDGQQLQLWTTANGQTENLGSPKANQPGELPELKFIENPTQFFITLENAGDAPERPNRWRTVMTTGRISY